MKPKISRYLMLTVALLCQAMHAAAAEPLLQCESKVHEFMLTLNTRAEGLLAHQGVQCPFKVASLEDTRMGRANMVLSLEFELENCRPDVFYRAGFLKIGAIAANNYSGYVLALAGKNTFACAVAPSQVKALIK